MRRRLLAALAALVLALLGTVILVGYARGADARALQGVQTVSVLVVAEKIPAGTSADQIQAKVRSELIPAKAAASGRVGDLQDLKGKVTTVDLQPGEQLLASRFAAPADVQGTSGLPDGKQEISVLLEAQRAVGGQLKAGDTVGVYVSLKQPDGSATTHAVLHQLLVTGVQGGVAQDTAKQGSAQSGSGASVMVSLAVTARQAEAVVFGQEHGTLWLSLEPKGADTAGTTVVTNGNVYTGAY
jgi:pilus assembly protein CpaB